MTVHFGKNRPLWYAFSAFFMIFSLNPVSYGVYDTLMDGNGNAYGAIEDEDQLLMNQRNEIPVTGFPYGRFIIEPLQPAWTWLLHTLKVPGKEIRPTEQSGKQVTTLVTFLTFAILVFNWYNINWGSYLQESLIHKIFVSSQLLWIIFLFLRIIQQPRSQEQLSYYAPFVPVLPIAAIWFNVYLMMRLSQLTWIRFIVWCSLGMIIYFGYGISNSKLANDKNGTFTKNLRMNQAYSNLDAVPEESQYQDNQYQESQQYQQQQHHTTYQQEEDATYQYNNYNYDKSR